MSKLCPKLYTTNMDKMAAILDSKIFWAGLSGFCINVIFFFSKNGIISHHPIKLKVEHDLKRWPKIIFYGPLLLSCTYITLYMYMNGTWIPNKKQQQKFYLQSGLLQWMLEQCQSWHVIWCYNISYIHVTDCSSLFCPSVTNFCPSVTTLW